MDNIINTHNVPKKNSIDAMWIQIKEIDKQLDLKYLYITHELHCLNQLLESSTNYYTQIIKNLK